MIVFTNKKNGKPYLFNGDVVDATNATAGRVMSHYTDLETGNGYVREVSEFTAKFSAGDASDADAILYRQGHMNSPMLTLLQGTVARLDMLLGLTDASHEDDNGDPDLERSPEWQAYLNQQNEFIDSMADQGLFKKFILKIQRQIYPPPDENTGYLVYDEEKKFFTNMTMPQEVKDMFGEADLKIYVKARLWCDGTLQVVHPVKEQPW